MKKFKKVIAMGLTAMAAVSAMSINAFAAYNVPEMSDDGISLYVNYEGAPLNDNVGWYLSNGSFRDTMNGLSSSNGRGYSDRWFKTTSTKSCHLDVSNVDTNGEKGTVTFIVKDRSNGETMKDPSGKSMIYTFTSNDNGEITGITTKNLVFSSQAEFYFEIQTSNPKTTKCYGYYTVSAY